MMRFIAWSSVQLFTLASLLLQCSLNPYFNLRRSQLPRVNVSRADNRIVRGHVPWVLEKSTLAYELSSACQVSRPTWQSNLQNSLV